VVDELALCLNAGSSSLKFALFRVDLEGEESLATGAVERLGTPEARAQLRTARFSSEKAVPNAEVHSALALIFEFLAASALPKPTVIGHRVVHGGPTHVAPARIEATLLADLKRLVPLAPLHLPAGIAGIEAALQQEPSVLQVACFDTAFHAGLPERAARFALPERFYFEGIRRYGFHGLSYESALSMLGDPPPARVVVAHLGSGVSLCAIENGRSIDTTMGLTPIGGVMMGTRPGDLDPGLVLYLLREKGYSVAQLEVLLNHEAGLFGVGGSNDLRALETKQSCDEGAALALEMFSYQLKKTIGGYVAALGGIDCLVFTGGIGEHSADVRARVCAGLEVMGIVLDPEKNGAGEAAIHSSRSRARIFVLESDEDRMIARHAARLARAQHSGLTPRLD